VANAPSDDIHFAEFLDDYFVECEEHLAVARRSLLALEPSVGQLHVDRPALDELFRSFHSLKGLSAMVGVREAEQLAHQMESYLSALRKEQLRLSADGLDGLMDGVKTLEQVISARRQGAPAPDIQPLFDRLASLLPTGELPPGPAAASDQDPSDLGADKAALLAAALQNGARAWLFTFTPSPALAQRGVNVNTVRLRLQEIGELIHATPQVRGRDQITFVFIVASHAPENDFSPWQADGLTYAPLDPPPAAAAAAAANEGAPPAGGGPGTHLTPSNIVRVDLSRLDDLMRLVGELVISRARLEDNLGRLEAALPPSEWRTLQETNLAIERQLRDLREGVMRVRMVPVREVFARMQFVVRDLTREYRKKVKLELSGQETEIDKLVVDRMMDPLLHLVRNAVSHGLEAPDERLAQGKPAEGTITLRASTTGETIVIEVEDDGRGLDPPAIMARARAAGMVRDDAPAEAATLLDAICTPGFSTRDEADRASGRGVGMTVVRSVAEELGGSLSVASKPGHGACFTVRLPLTLAIADALIVTVSGQTFAIPQVSVREVIQVQPETLTILENNELVPYHGGVLPLLRLAPFFGLASPPDRAFNALVVSAGLSAVGLAVDRVLGLREIVVRPLTDPLIRVPGVAGATELGDGRVVLILDATTLARRVRKQARKNWTKTESDGLPGVALYVAAN
jgi:two-component system, chemotaxis family, sensor kinase CheA